MAPGMYARRDIPKWMTGVKDAENVIIRAQGGLDNRAGTILASGYDTSSGGNPQYLVPFEASDDDTYMLEFGDQIMRVLKDGNYVLSTEFAGQEITSVTTADPARLEMVDAPAASNFTVGRLAYVSDPNGSSVFHNAIVEVEAIASEFITFKIVGGVNVDTTSGSWGSIGSGALLFEVYEVTSPYDIEDMTTIQFTQDVDTMVFAHTGYQPYKLVRTSDAEWDFSALTFQPEIGTPTGYATTVSALTNADPVVLTTVDNPHSFGEGDPVIFTSVGGMTQLNNNVYYATNVTANTLELYDRDGNSIDGTGFGTYTSGGDVYSMDALADVGSGSVEYRYKVAAVNAETGEEGLPSEVINVTNDLTTAGNINRVVFPTVEDADFYRVYKEFSGIYGYVGITQGQEFEDENITPNTAENPQDGRDPFDGVTNRPAVAAFVDQRLTLAATLANPQAVEMSTSSTPFNFNRALTPGASDAISFRMRSQKLNRIRHIIDADKPLVLTAGGEWYIKVQEDGALAPGTFKLSAATFRGSAQVPRPVLVGSTMLHVTRDGNTIREFSLDVSRDTASADLTLLARHLFEGQTITSMAYAQAPDSVIWVTLDNGALYSLTYLEEHEVWGWTRHELAGTNVSVKQVEVVTEGAFDVPYFVVERTLYGGTVTLVERLDTRQFDDVTEAYFVDCGFRYSGASTNSLRGYLHLRGEDVTVLADGNVLEGISVNDQGVVTASLNFTKAAIGLGYASYIVTLDADFGDQIQDIGSSIGSFVSTSEVAIKVVDTRGISVGMEGKELNEVKEFTGASPIPLATKTHVVTIDGDWSRDAAIEVWQLYPLPMTITAVAPSWSIGDE